MIFLAGPLINTWIKLLWIINITQDNSSVKSHFQFFCVNSFRINKYLMYFEQLRLWVSQKSVVIILRDMTSFFVNFWRHIEGIKIYYFFMGAPAIISILIPWQRGTIWAKRVAQQFLFTGVSSACGVSETAKITFNCDNCRQLSEKLPSRHIGAVCLYQ